MGQTSGSAQRGMTYALEGTHIADPPSDQAAAGPSAVRGTILVSRTICTVLIDTGATHPFLAFSIVEGLGLEQMPADPPIFVETPVGEGALIEQRCHACEVTLGGVDFKWDFFVMKLETYDVILGMDWLVFTAAEIDFHRRRVLFTAPDHTRGTFIGEWTVDASRLGPLRQSWGDLTHQLDNLTVMDTRRDAGTALPHIVDQFLDVFPEDLVELPPM